MASVALGVAGGFIGNVIAPGVGAKYGWAVGTLLGAALEGSKSATQNLGKLDSLDITGSGYGAPIPWVYGRHRLAGNVIFSTRLLETSEKSGVRLLGTRRRTYSYSVSCAVMICRGPITAVHKIWADDLLIYDSANSPATKYDATVYLGTWDQEPDITIEDELGDGMVPAYRGRAYVVFANLPLADWGNRIPNFQFEVEALPSYEAVVMADNPAVYYRFEDTPGTLADSSGNGYTQTLTSGTTAQIAGRHGEALQSVGVTSTRQAVVGSVAALQPAALSVEAWFQYKGGTPTSGANRFRYRNPTSGEFAWELVLEPNLFLSTLVVTFRIFTNASGTVTVHQYSFARDTAWHHVVVSYDTNGDSVLYLDNVEVDRDPAPVDPVTITAAAGNLIELIVDDNIHVDEVAMYPAALSATQVDSHWEQRMRVRDVLADVFGEVGLEQAEWDVSEAVDDLDGFKVDGRTEARQVIAPLLQVFATDLLERDGLLAAKKRGGASVVTIPEEDLAARLWNPSDEPPSPVQARRLQELELPFRVDLAYHSATKDYEIATQGSLRYSKQHLQEALTLNTGLVFTDDLARQKAEELLYRLWIEREGFEFSLPPRYSYLTPGDIVTLPVAGGTARVRLTRLDLGLPGPLRCEAVLDDVDVLTQIAPGGALTDAGNIPAAVEDTTLLVWASNAVVDEDAYSLGIYAAAAGSSTGYWTGAQLYWSRDGGTTYQPLAPLSDPAVHGTAATVLAAGTSTGTVDNTNTVNVTLTNGTLETVSEAEMLAGENTARLGGEIIRFRTVTPLGGGVYQLSGLLRGQRGTDHFWATHAIGEPFVLLEEGLYTRVDLPSDIVGKLIYFKAPTADGQTLAAATAHTVLVSGAVLLAYSPVNLAATRDGSSNMTITWKRRTRIGGELADYTDVPLDFEVEECTVSILDDADWLVTAVTSGAQLVVTAPGNPFALGDEVYLEGFGGMVGVNGLIAEVVADNGSDLTLSLDTRTMPTWTSGGALRGVVRTITASTPTAAYSAADQTVDFGSPQPSVMVSVSQIGDDGRRGLPRNATL